MGQVSLMRRAAIPLVAFTAMIIGDVARAQNAGSLSTAAQTSPDASQPAPELKGVDAALHVASYDDLVAYAHEVATRPGMPRAELPPELAKLDYDLFRMIAFRSERALGKDKKLPFWFEFFHRGFVHRDRVEIHLISSDSSKHEEGANEPPQVTDLPFSMKWFQYRGPLASMEVPAETGFAGLRVLGRFPGAKHPQEILTFLGASYFRGHSGDTVYGTSARGLAINPAAGVEEFPVFREFWIQEPKSGDEAAVVLALLDSASVAGAYELTLHPGNEDSIVDVRSTLFFRNPDVKIGIAPLTSMWMWGDGLEGPPKDPRPSVHDSDGLEIHDGARWIWRPLSRQDYPSLSGFPVDSLRGFGLLQRERDEARYLDDEARYHARPSVWIETANAWPRGTVELFEMPAIHEGHDNIVAYWVPGEKPKALAPLSLEYRVHFSGMPHPAEMTSFATVQRTDISRGDDGTMQFGVTFARSRAASNEPDSEAAATSSQTPLPEIDITTIRCELVGKSLTTTNGREWKALLTVRPVTDKDPVELRATLMKAGAPVSETWTYLAAQDPPPYRYPNVYTRQD
jgi:glucans biosynthesis protein